MTFEELQKNAAAEWEALIKSSSPRIYVDTSTLGIEAGSLKVLEQLKTILKEQNVKAQVIETGSLGISYLEPVIAIAKPGQPSVYYGRITPETTVQLVKDYVQGDNPHPELAFATSGDGEIPGIPKLADLPFFKPQVRIVLCNSGFISPDKINHYIAAGGYSGLDKAFKMAPEAIIDEVKKSGLKGRGGAGFPTGDKWLAGRDAAGTEKYLICNADEADPSVYNGRTLLESDPHSVLEGMLIAAYAIGATHGYVYINDEYDLAISRLETALQQMREAGLLGENITGTGFNFDIEIRKGAGAFICGEETALIRSMEGNRGMPFIRPPYPTAAGFNGKPTVVNDVETLAAVSAIFQKRADWYAGYGKESKGTKLITLSGKVNNPGLAEVPFGMTLRQIIFDIGGGIANGKEFKAALVGGPVGGFLNEMSLDIPFDYQSLISNGAVMGTGSIYVADNEECIVELTGKATAFTAMHSCGQCSIGRGGTAQMNEFVKDITKGEAKPENIELLRDLGEVMKLGALCGLGKNACNPVVSAINNFADEVTAHVGRRRCPAKVCKALITFYINPNNCQGCQKCLTACPEKAITGGDKLIHIINQEKCTKCGLCLPACPADYNAITKATGGRMPPLPTEPVAAGSL